MTTMTSPDAPPRAASPSSTMDRLRALSRRALARMYLPDQRLFVFTVRRRRDAVIPEGVSRRYTAIALLGLAGESEDTVRDVLAGADVHAPCDRLLDDVSAVENIGDVALTLWAARALGHHAAERALQRLEQLDPVSASLPTVELAWCVTALSMESDAPAGNRALAEATADRLMASFVPGSDLFPHWPVGARAAPWRSHVACFADLVYPIQALARFHATTGHERAMELAGRCANRMCALQGPHGQWWWHFDVRTGRVIEPYPVYAVHQDAMAPMALFAVQDAGGADHSLAVRRGLEWLMAPEEVATSLVDPSADLVWRKVARHEPGKLSRSAQALAGRLHPALRVPGLSLVFRPGAVDFECRPYHLGWLLYAWRQGRTV